MMKPDWLKMHQHPLFVTLSVMSKAGRSLLEIKQEIKDYSSEEINRFWKYIEDERELGRIGSL
jgi:hypothetical protein